MKFIYHQKYNKAKQHQPLRVLDSLAAALFVHGFAIVTQKSQQQVCRCWRRYENRAACGFMVAIAE